MSCQKIVFNLHKAWEQVPGIEIRNFNFSVDSRSDDIHNFAHDILEWNPDTIVVLDHKPHPLHFFRFLLPYYEGKKKPKIVIQVFGDFTLYYKEWFGLGPFLKGFPVKFIVASERQKDLIDKFLTPHMETSVCPFPVRSEDFYFDLSERYRQRAEWEVFDDEVVFTFTGRISRQKRTHLLLKVFHEAILREPKKRFRLFIYGLADHIGDNFLDIWDNENEYFRKVHRVYMALPESTRSRIHFMGSVPNSDLRPVYAGADFLVNLSVHNDEDFGMSVAEAQMTGLPAILTDWGGLASFEHPSLPKATKYLPVRIGEFSKVISSEKATVALCEAINETQRVDREKLIELAREKFSVATAGKILTRILDEDFSTFVSFSEFHTLITMRMVFKQPVYMTRHHKINPLFRKLYSSYVRHP